MPYLCYCQFNESSVELLHTWSCYQGLPFCHSGTIRELGQKRDFSKHFTGGQRGLSDETSEARTAPPPAVGKIHALRQP